MKKIFFIFVLGFISGCSGSSGEFDVLFHPTDIRVSLKDVTLGNQTTRLVYVANRLGGTVSVLDQVSEIIADTDLADHFDNTPIIVGGEPVAIAVEDRAKAPRVYVADAQNKQLFAFDAIPPTDPSKSNEIAHVPVDLGGATVQRASTPIFRNQDRASDPFLKINSLDSTVIPEHWEVTFLNDSDGYKVEGSKSGEQKGRALEGKKYTNDKGTISFTITAGGDPTTEGDEFRFGTQTAKPLNLPGIPVNLQIASGKLYIVTKAPANLVTFDLASLTVLSTVVLTDGSATEPLPGKSAVGGGHLYVPNQANTNVLDLDLSTNPPTQNLPINTGFNSSVASLDGKTSLLHLIPVGKRNFSSWNITGAKLESDLNVSNYGLALEPITLSGKIYEMVSTVSGSIDFIDIANRKRFDTDVTSGDRQSTAININFYDAGPTSSPQLLAVQPKDGVAVTETWQLIYDSGTASYEAIGSRSGVQTNRVKEGVPYTSDDGSISLTIRPSVTDPVTNGDFFSFEVVDGINPLQLPGKLYSSGMAVLTPPGQTDQTVYVINEESNSISLINLNDFTERKTIK